MTSKYVYNVVYFKIHHLSGLIIHIIFIVYLFLCIIILVCKSSLASVYTSLYLPFQSILPGMYPSILMVTRIHLFTVQDSFEKTWSTQTSHISEFFKKTVLQTTNSPDSSNFKLKKSEILLSISGNVPLEKTDATFLQDWNFSPTQKTKLNFQNC